MRLNSVFGVVAVVGMSIQAEAAAVSPRHYEPLTPEAAQSLAQSLPNNPTEHDLLANSAAAHDVPLALTTADSPKAKPRTRVAAAKPSLVSASPACANGFTRAPYGKSAFVCFQNQQVPNDGFITEMDTQYLIGTDGQGLLTYDDFGTGGPAIAYGFLSQRVWYAKPQVGPVDGATYEEGEYDNYFLASTQDADAVKSIFCGRGEPVTYEGPSGTIGPDGKPSGGYQVQVAAFAPGTSDPSPLPPGDTNICPPSVAAN